MIWWPANLRHRLSPSKRSIERFAWESQHRLYGIPWDSLGEFEMGEFVGERLGDRGRVWESLGFSIPATGQRICRAPSQVLDVSNDKVKSCLLGSPSQWREIRPLHLPSRVSTSLLLVTEAQRTLC